MSQSPHELEYHRSAAGSKAFTPGRVSGTVSIVIGILFGTSAILCPLDVLEGLALMFYCYIAVFSVGIVFGIVGLMGKDKSARRALCGIILNTAAMFWRCGELYFEMRAMHALGWMNMPFPFR
jgi:hypothetical protein